MEVGPRIVRKNAWFFRHGEEQIMFRKQDQCSSTAPYFAYIYIKSILPIAIDTSSVRRVCANKRRICKIDAGVGYGYATPSGRPTARPCTWAYPLISRHFETRKVRGFDGG